MMIDFIRRSWRSLFDTDVRKVTQRDCEAWLSRYQQQYSPSVVNNSIGTLRAIFDEAIRTGARRLMVVARQLIRGSSGRPCGNQTRSCGGPGR